MAFLTIKEVDTKDWVYAGYITIPRTIGEEVDDANYAGGPGFAERTTGWDKGLQACQRRYRLIAPYYYACVYLLKRLYEIYETPPRKVLRGEITRVADFPPVFTHIPPT